MSGRVDSDAVLHAALRQVNVERENEKVDLHGPHPNEVRRAQAEARAWYLSDTVLGMRSKSYGPAKAFVEGGVVDSLVAEAKRRLVDKVEKHSGKLEGLMVQAGIMTIECALKTIEEGYELRASLVRTCAYLATCGICIESLPDGFLAAKIAEVPPEYRPAPGSARLPWPRGADLAHTAILARPDAAEIKRAFNESCREGQRIALTSARCPEELDILLRRADVQKRYENDPAFRVGFDSARWALENHKDDELRSNLGIFDRVNLSVSCRG